MSFAGLHFQTLSLVLFLVFLANALFSTLFYWSGQAFRGARLWIAGQLMGCLGIASLGFRDVLPPVVPIVFANTLLICSQLVILHSIWVLRFTEKFPRGTYMAVPATLLLFLLFQDQAFHVRVMLFSALQGLASLATAILLLVRIEKPYLISNILAAVPFAAMAVVSGLRFAFNLRPDDLSLESLDDFNGLVLLLSVMTASATLFGYFLMNVVRLEQELGNKDRLIEKRNAELEELNRSKDLFFNVIAHDLRGPIGGSARYVRKHLLNKREILPEKRNEIEVLAGSLERTHEFLEKLLWWSRSYLEAWEPVPVLLDVREVLGSVRDLLKSDLELKDVSVGFFLTDSDPCCLADRQCVEMILLNLFSNAVKFSDIGGKIEVSTAREAGRILIRILDHGVGVSEEHLSRLFRIESKVSSRGTRGETGSGLGLILSKKLAERNGGSLSLESAGEGMGTSAVLSLPLPPEGPG